MAQRTIGARLYLTLIGILLACAGGVFTGLMWRSFQRARAVEEWPKVPCAILESRVIEEHRVGPDEPPDYRFGVTYSYEWEDRSYDSKRLSLRGSPWSKSSAEAERLVREYPAGTVAECRVNPEIPLEAVLEGDTRAPGYAIWFPLIFVFGGFGVVFGAWRR